MFNTPIPYGRQNITEEDISEVVKVLKSDFLTQGPAISKFEEEFAKYVGSKYAVAVCNGTAALHLCAMAMGVKPGQKVITTPITFAASANCIKYCGGEVVFADIDRDTYLLDIKKVRKLLETSSKNTYAGIIPVDFTGLPVNMEEFRELADEFGLWIIEDACHAPGAYFNDSTGKKQFCGNGNLAELAIFSFHPVKHIAAGEGGMITTNDESLYKKLQLLRTHGITKDVNQMHQVDGGWYYEMLELGYNYRITDFQAALGLSQLKRADAGLLRRQEIAAKYDKAFKEMDLIRQKRQDGILNAYHLYVIEVSNRKELYEYLRKNNIFSQVHYIPIHMMPYYQQFGWKKGDLPNAENYYSQCLSLPMYPSLTNSQLDFVIKTVNEFYS